MKEEEVIHLVNTFPKLVGTRQVLRAIIEAQLRLVIVAKDADSKLKKQIEGSCKDKNIPIVYTLSKRELGTIVGIEVACACIGILK